MHFLSSRVTKHFACLHRPLNYFTMINHSEIIGAFGLGSLFRNIQ